MGFWLREAGSRGDKFVIRRILLFPEVMTSAGGISTDGGQSQSRIVMVIQTVVRVWKLSRIRKIMRVQKMVRDQKSGRVREDKGSWCLHRQAGEEQEEPGRSDPDRER